MTNIPIFKTIKKENNNLSKVYFSCFSEDFNKYFKTISDEILSIQDCNIYYLENRDYYPNNEEEKEDYFSYLKDINLFVFPITFKYLMEDSLSKNIDFKFAKKNKYPILPILVESGLTDLFNQRFGNIQTLDIYDNKEGIDTFTLKLNKYLNTVLVSREKVEKIRKAFNTYIFLSYRKKDRKYAQEIMTLLHRNNFMRDVAIWYDENLTPGRDFNDEILDIMKKSNIVSFVVTPNINEKDNYVLTVEYPAAVNNNKPILPIESLHTDKEVLHNYFKNFPDVINKNNTNELTDKLKELILINDYKENNDPEHLFYIGLAYLNAIDVERDTKKAIKIIETSALQNYIPAIKCLVDIYEDGIGVLVNYKECIRWQKIYVDILNGLSVNDEILLESKSSLATLYANDGQYDEAFALNQDCYEVRLKTLGEHHPDTLNSLNSLAASYLHLGNYEKALELNKKCYESCLKAYGENHPDTLDSLNNMASNYYELGNYEKAIELNQKCYEARCKMLGENNPSTLITLDNLAISYSDFGNFEKAIELDRACYEARLKTLGEHHPDTIRSLNNLAFCYSKIRNFDKALQLFQNSYDISSKILGADHPDSLRSLNNLAYTYSSLRYYGKAIEIDQMCYKARLKIFGENHPDTLTSLNNLASCYSDIGNDIKASELYQKCYETSLIVFGEEHPNTLRTLGNLAYIYSNLGNYNKAIEIDQKCYEISLRVFGAYHPDTLRLLNNLAFHYSNLDNNKKTIELSQKCYETSCKIYGENHPDTLGYLNNLAFCYSNIGNNDKANELFLKCYEARIRVLGENHPDTIMSLGNLAASYSLLGDYKTTKETKTERHNITNIFDITDLKINSNPIISSYDHVSMDRYNKSIELYKKCYQQCINVFGRKNRITLNTLLDLSVAYCKAHQYLLAIETGEKCYKELILTPEKDNLDVFSLLYNLSSAYFNIDNFIKAKDRAEICYNLSINKKNNKEEMLQIIGMLININSRLNDIKEVKRLTKLYSNMSNSY